MDIAFITTCKGRLQYLEQTLPSMLGAMPDEMIVVDYGCPQYTAKWARELYPEARVVEVSDDPGFNLGRARNSGAAETQKKWLCFIDADIVVDERFKDWLASNLTEQEFFRVHQDDAPDRSGIWGTVICSRQAFNQVEGYDEAIVGYGGDDTDFYERLKAAGFLERRLPADLLTCLDNAESEKTAFYPVKDETKSLKIGHLYRYIKYTISRVLGRQPSLNTRQGLYRYVRGKVISDGASTELSDAFDMEVRTLLHQQESLVDIRIEFKISSTHAPNT